MKTFAHNLELSSDNNYCTITHIRQFKQQLTVGLIITKYSYVKSYFCFVVFTVPVVKVYVTIVYTPV